MTLKLIDKNLKSKYAEALYKNESSYDKEIDKRYKRLTVDYMRSAQYVESNKQVFLNSVRQKRTKWFEDDSQFRDNYKTMCRKVHKKKIENLIEAYDKKKLGQFDKETRDRFELLQQQLYLSRLNTDMMFKRPQRNDSIVTTSSVTAFEGPRGSIVVPNAPRMSIVPGNRKASEAFLSGSFLGRSDSIKPGQDSLGSKIKFNNVNRLVIDGVKEEQAGDADKKASMDKRMSSVPKLPKIEPRKSQSISSLNNDLYTRYTKSDRMFLDSLPAKVELTVTDVGKSFLRSKKHQFITQRRQAQTFLDLQSNALNDNRFNDLVDSLGDLPTF